MKNIWIITFFTLFSSVAFAGEEIYQCQIDHVYSLTDSGSLNVSNFEKEFKGNKFTVIKSTGEIKGETLTTIKATETKVINAGSKENSYKAIALFKDQAQVIEIQEFKTNEIKPFVASSMGGAGIVTGNCK
jgi:hypothetical protein